MCSKYYTACCNRSWYDVPFVVSVNHMHLQIVYCIQPLTLIVNHMQLAMNLNVNYYS